MNDQHAATAVSTRTLYPALRYEDARAAITFLTTVFGFAEHVVYTAEDGTIAHAELVLGDDMLMLGQMRDDGNVYSKHVTTPLRAGGAVTGSIYAYCADPDALHARAVAAGAEIIQPPYDTDYGSHDVSVRDPGGYFWTFGTYRP